MFGPKACSKLRSWWAPMGKTVTAVLVTTVIAWGCVCVSLGMAEASEAAPIRFAVIGDRTGSHQPGIHGQIIAEIQRLRPDFVLSVGDMIEGYSGDMDAVDREWEEYKELRKPLTMPVHAAPGNHDIWDEPSLELYKRHIGEPYYSFDVKDIHLLVLDTSRWDSTSALPREQMDWLKSDLTEHRDAAYTIAVLHKPYWIETTAAGRPDPLHTVFVDHGVDAVFTGHYHVYFSGEFDGVLYTGIGSSGGYCEPGVTGLDYHFAWVTVDEAGITIAPIKMGAVLPWEEVTAQVYRYVAKVEEEALDVERLRVGKDLTVPETRVAVAMSNFDSLLSVGGALRWDVPEGWKVFPKSLPIEIGPLGTHEAEFVISASGALYPVPVLSVDYPYAEGKDFEIKKPLSIIRSVTAHEATERPVIDGELTEAIWHDPTRDFFAPDGSPTTADPVDFYFAWDRDNLYLAARCMESEIASMVAAFTDHDAAIYGEDCVGYFLQPTVPAGPVYQIYFSPLGTVFDQVITVRDGKGVSADPAWNGTYEVKTSKGSDHWNIEIRMPLEQLGVSGTYGDKWTLNFRRKQKRLNTAADWQVPLGYDPKDYGVLAME